MINKIELLPLGGKQDKVLINAVSLEENVNVNGSKRSGEWCLWVCMSDKTGWLSLASSFFDDNPNESSPLFKIGKMIHLAIKDKKKGEFIMGDHCRIATWEEDPNCSIVFL